MAWSDMTPQVAQLTQCDSAFILLIPIISSGTKQSLYAHELPRKLYKTVCSSRMKSPHLLYLYSRRKCTCRHIAISP